MFLKSIDERIASSDNLSGNDFFLTSCVEEEEDDGRFGVMQPIDRRPMTAAPDSDWCDGDEGSEIFFNFLTSRPGECGRIDKRELWNSQSA